MRYRVTFFSSDYPGCPMRDYLDRLSDKQRAKILKFTDFLAEKQGYLDEPYTRHISGKMSELSVNNGGIRHRIFYFTFINQNIILLHAFS